MVSNNWRATDSDSWELDPTPRDNTHIWTKSVPVDVTLTTAGTAQNLFSIDTDIPTVNMATNPSFETGDPPTGYVAVGATISQSAVVARNNTNSILVNPDNAAAGEGFYWITPSVFIPQNEVNQRNLVVSIYLQDNADSGNGARIVIADDAGTTITNGNTIALSSAWQRSTASLSLFQRAAQTYRIYVVTSAQHNTNFYADALQVEVIGSDVASVYVDGTTGVNDEWFGTAHASISRRRKGLVSVRGYTLYTTGDIYIAEDQTASATTGRFVRAGTDFWEDFPIHVKSNISFINVNPGETPQVYGVIRGVHYGQIL